MIFGLGVIVLMLAINAVFAAYEMALATITRARLLMLVNLNKSGSQDALYMKEHMEGSLAVVQLGINLVAAVAAAIGGLGVEEHLSPIFKDQWHLSNFWADTISLACLVIPLTCFTIIFAELIPKTFAIYNHEYVCLRLSPYMRILGFWINPLISVLENIVKKSMVFINKRRANDLPSEENMGLHELKAAVAMARTSRLLGASQERILLSAAQLSSRSVDEIMIPINDVCTIAITNTLSEALIRAHNDMHTRFPVCRDANNPQSIEGYINFKDIISGLKLNPSDPSIKGIMRSIKKFQDKTSISSVMEQMINEKLHISLVVSKEETVIGMVTLEDIIEELVGEIEDEFDRIPSYVHPYGDTGWLVGAGITMGVLAQTTLQDFSLEPPDEKLKLADWFAKQVNQPLKGGEIVKINNLQLMARKLRRNKLAEAAVILEKGDRHLFP